MAKFKVGDKVEVNMAKFKVGDKVRVKSNLTYEDGHPRSLSC